MVKKVWKDSRKKRPQFQWKNGYLVGICPLGYHLVMDHFRNRKGSRSMALEVEGEGVYVEEYCAKNPKRRKR